MRFRKCGANVFISGPAALLVFLAAATATGNVAANFTVRSGNGRERRLALKAAKIVPMGANPGLSSGGVPGVHAVLFHALEYFPRFDAKHGVPKDFERMGDAIPEPFQGLHA